MSEISSVNVWLEDENGARVSEIKRVEARVEGPRWFVEEDITFPVNRRAVTVAVHPILLHVTARRSISGYLVRGEREDRLNLHWGKAPILEISPA